MYLVLLETNGVERAYAVIEDAHPLLRQTLQTLANTYKSDVIARRLLGPKTSEELRFQPQQ